MQICIILFFIISGLFSQDIQDGYVLYTPGGMSNDNTSYLRDIDGSLHHSWEHNNGPASMPYLHPGNEPGFENTLLYYPCRVSNPTMNAGGVGGRIEIYNWNGDLLWSYELSNNDYQHHHDIDVLPNGNILLIAWERKYSDEWQEMGRQSVQNNLNQMWPLVIFEILPNLENGDAEIVWEWRIWDHMIQDRGDDYGAFFGQIEDHPELMDINCGNVGSNGGPGGQANGDWLHANAIDYNADLDQIALSLRHINEIFIIDHSTTTEEAASHSGGNSGMGGDLLYRWGNPSNYGRGDDDDEILVGQHGVNWIEEGFPGEGNLIIYNNQHSFNLSAVLEIQTPINDSNTYNINENEAFGPEGWVWFHEGSYFSDVQSGAFRLQNGNTLITDANSSLIIEVTQEGNQVWEYNYPSGSAMIARAQKYSYDYFDFENVLLGDVNEDGIINILDVILTVNIVLGIDDFQVSADVNQDGIINILDVVLVVNIILGE